MAPIFRLEKFPHVCRLCLKAWDSQPVAMVALSATDPVLDDESIGDFITAITFMISEDKHHLLPNMVCLPCLELLRFFAKYRSKIITVHLLMNSLVELKRSNSVPLVDLFRTKSDLLRAVIKDLDLCTVQDYSVQDLLDEFSKYGDSGAAPAEHANGQVTDALIPETNLMEDENPDSDTEDSYSSTPDEVQVTDALVPQTNLLEDENPDSNAEDSYSSTSDELDESTKGYPILPGTDSSDDSICKKKKLPVKSKVKGRKLVPALKCDKCNFKSYNRHNLKTHQKTHDNGEIPCKEPGCTEVFKTSELCRQHCSVAHKSFVCDICGLRYPSSHSLKTHMERHLKKFEHECPYCQKKLNAKRDLRYHIASVHRNECQFPCETCGLIFRKKPTLNEHILTHSDALNYACKFCDKRFRRNQNLKKHVKVVHEMVRHPCSHCASTFQTTYKLKDHIESVHGIQTRFLCDVCVQLFDSQDKLDIHRVRHDNPNELECPTCLFMFPSEDKLGSHMCITYRDDYMCCGRDLRYHYFYNKHMLIKHGVRTNVRVKPIPGLLVGQMRAKRKRIETCPKCEKTFITRTQKKEHMKICAGPEGGSTAQAVEEEAVSPTIHQVASVITVATE